jgi:hypothetical protein
LDTKTIPLFFITLVSTRPFIPFALSFDITRFVLFLRKGCPKESVPKRYGCRFLAISKQSLQQMACNAGTPICPISRL